MATDSERLAELRAQVRRRQRAAGQKIWRVRDHGTEIAGTKYDPRYDLKKVDKMTGKQLESALSKLDKFVSRKTQFVTLGGKDKTVVPMDKWRIFQREMTKYNKAVAPLIERAENTKAPWGEWTLAERYMSVDQEKEIRFNPGHVHRVDIKPKEVVSSQALDKLIKAFKKRNSKKYLEFKYKQEKDMFQKMAKHSYINVNADKIIKSMTRDQFMVAWEYGGLPQALTLFVTSPKSKPKGLTDDEFEKRVEAFTNSDLGNQFHSRFDEIVEWASNLEWVRDKHGKIIQKGMRRNGEGQLVEKLKPVRYR